MLRTRSGLPRFAAKWVAQVAASVGATALASLIYTALPKPVLSEAPASQPELTSGGKFAARAITPVAYDGLDAMPAPHVVPSAVRLVAATPSADVALPPAVERRVPKPVRAMPRTEARHGAVPAEAMPRLASSAAVVTAAQPVAATRPEPGRDDGGFMAAILPSAMPTILPTTLPSVLPKVVSTARAAWTLTASAGESLVARVVPQVP